MQGAEVPRATVPECQSARGRGVPGCDGAADLESGQNVESIH